MTRRIAPHAASDECPICREILNGPLTRTRKGWARKACALRERGE